MKAAMKAGPNVTINGREYPTVITGDTQRFPVNRAIAFFVREGRRRGGPDLNELWERYAEGQFADDEVRELYRLLGYTVTGYADIFPDDVIENPLWEAL